MDIERKYNKCDIHPIYNKNTLLFEEDNIQTQICLVCAKKLTNSLNKTIDIDEFLQADENHIFSSFPPLADIDIYESLQNIQVNSSQQEILIERIEEYFTSLQKEINQKIDQIKNKAKAKLIQINDQNGFQMDQFLKEYNKISSKFEIQNLYKQQNQDSELKLKEIIKEKYQNISQNTQQLQEFVSSYQQSVSQIEFQDAKEIQQKILGLLDQIEFFKQKPNNSIDTIELEKSKYRSSQKLAIERLQNKSIQIRQNVDGNGRAYLNFILDPTKRYVFRIKLQTYQQSDSFLVVGIIQEQLKDNNKLYDGICYNETGDYMTIKKIIKGNNVYEGRKQNIDKEIEMRIHLGEKMIKVGNYPSYENVSELENKYLIEDNTQYRFAVELFYLVHKMILTHFSVVDKFDDNM